MNKFISFLADANIVLSIVGYQLVTVAFSGIMTDSTRIVTIPFRALCVLIAFLIIFLNAKKRIQTNGITKLYLIYWLFVLFRFIEFCYFSNFELKADNVNLYWLYMIFLTLLPIVAILKSLESINLNRCFLWCYYISCATVLLLFITNPQFQEVSDVRLDGNKALNTITTGHIGVTNIILGICLIDSYNIDRYKKYAVITIAIVAGIVLLRAGSRGPLLTLVVCIVCWIAFKKRTMSAGILAILIVLALIYVFQDQIIEWIKTISPAMERRLTAKKDISSGRDVLYLTALRHFWNSPILGDRFALMLFGSMYYPHNIFVESLMQTGIVGFTMLLVVLYNCFKTLRLIILNRWQYWAGMLWLQQFGMLLTSGTLAISTAFSIFTVLLLNQITIMQENDNNEIVSSGGIEYYE